MVEEGVEDGVEKRVEKSVEGRVEERVEKGVEERVEEAGGVLVTGALKIPALTKKGRTDFLADLTQCRQSDQLSCNHK